MGKTWVAQACRTIVYAMGGMRALISAMLPKMSLEAGPGIVRRRHWLSKLNRCTTTCSQGVPEQLVGECISSGYACTGSLLAADSGQLTHATAVHSRIAVHITMIVVSWSDVAEAESARPYHAV